MQKINEVNLIYCWPNARLFILGYSDLTVVDVNVKISISRLLYTARKTFLQLWTMGEDRQLYSDAALSSLYYQ